MQVMAKKKQQPRVPHDDGKQPNRSPSWTIYARIDPDLQEAVDRYIASQEYPPTIGRVVERALKDLLEKAGLWPVKAKRPD